MRLLYGRYYAARERCVAELLPANCSVVDLCCGPGVIYQRYLSRKHIEYLGLDGSPEFAAHVKKLGAQSEVWELSARTTNLPKADYLIMQGSLAYFLPDPTCLIREMLLAAREAVIISEPIRNLSTSKSPLVRKIAVAISGGPGGNQPQRFTEQTLDQLFAAYPVQRAFNIPGGRDKVYVLAPVAEARDER